MFHVQLQMPYGTLIDSITTVSASEAEKFLRAALRAGIGTTIRALLLRRPRNHAAAFAASIKESRSMNHIDPSEAATEVGMDYESDLIEGAGVFIWPAAVAVIVSAVATLFAWWPA